MRCSSKKFERMARDVCDVMFAIAKGKRPDDHLVHYRNFGREGMMAKPASKILGDVHKNLLVEKVKPNIENIVTNGSCANVAGTC